MFYYKDKLNVCKLFTSKEFLNNLSSYNFVKSVNLSQSQCSYNLAPIVVKIWVSFKYSQSLIYPEIVKKMFKHLSKQFSLLFRKCFIIIICFYSVVMTGIFAETYLI